MTEQEFRTTIETLAESHEYVGLRGQDDFEMREGEGFDHCSSMWSGDEYDEGDETYDGVCALDLGARTYGVEDATYERALADFRLFGRKSTGGYFYDHVAVIVGDVAEYGQDDGEIVISDATVALVLC